MLLRSAFWLGVGYLVIHPTAIDFRQAADATKDVLGFGQSAVVQQVASNCADAECIEILAAILTSNASTEPPGSVLLQDVTLNPPAPVPPPRPHWAG